MVCPGKIFGCYDFRKVHPEDLLQKARELIEKQKKKYDAIASLTKEELSCNTLLKPLADLLRERYTEGPPLDFPKDSAIDKDLRDASAEAERKLKEFDVEINMRKDIFDQIVAFQDHEGLGKLDAEEKRFVEKLIQKGKRNGLHLPMEIQAELKTIKKRMSELCLKYSTNLNEDNTKLYFTRAELDGMPEDFINSLEEKNGKLEVTLKYPHLFPVTKKCRVPSTRRQMEAASQSKCMEENTPLLEEVCELRHRQAQLLGYKNHASYVLEILMAETPENVAKFYDSLVQKFDKLWEKERGVMQKLKDEECEKLGLENSGTLEVWDVKYYMNQVEEKMYSVDQEEVRQYFPIEKVTAGLFTIYQDLLKLTFTEELDAEKWHDDVRMFRVNDKETDELMGYFFLDMYPREGKFNHISVFPLQPSCLTIEGEKEVAVIAMMCNFTKPTADKPALLDHSEVETYFHEFGHVMHFICSKVSIAMFTGLLIERDFLETPSQMLENWVWEKEALQLLSGHYKTGEPLPDDLLSRMTKCRKVNAGCFNLRQIALGSFDQKMHTMSSANTAELFKKIYEELVGVQSIPNTNMPANFVHIINGYDAQYYGYLWSEVYAADMYESRFKKEGILNVKVGMDYRNQVLAPGSSKDASDILRSFLGREPSEEAFLKSKGLDALELAK